MSTQETIRRFLEPAILNKWATIRSIIWQIVVSLQWPVNALFIGLIWGVLEANQPDLLTTFILIYAGFLVFIHVFIESTKTRGFAETYFPEMRIIQDRYLQEYVRIDGNYLDKMWTWKLISIINKWFDIRPMLLDNTINFTISFLVSFIVGIYLSAQVEWVFALVYILAFICIWLLSVYFDKPSGKWRIKRRDVLNEHSRGLVKFIMSKTEIIQNDKITQSIDTMWTYLDKAQDYALLQAVPQSRMFNVPRIIITIFRLSVYILGAKRYFRWDITLSTLTALLWFMLVIDGVMVQFINWYKNIVKDWNVMEKLRSTFDDAPKDIWLFEWDVFIQNKWVVDLKNISYEYPWSEKVFDNLSLTILWWHKTALVGPSWWGKSTLIKLIAGYIRPDSWSVIIDDQDLAEVSLRSYYLHIWYLTQEPSVFDGTIWENLTYGLQDKVEGQGQDSSYSCISPDKGRWSKTGGVVKKDTSEVITSRHDDRSGAINHRVEDKNKVDCFVPRNEDERGSLDASRWQKGNDEIIAKIEKVIKLARCEFIYEFKDWLMTEIGEKGVRLSWGQRQRLAIAKIMLKDPAIILLDEPTSALDSENEELVTQALNELFKGKTVIVIAHRLQTVKHADQILYIDGGQIIESWTHMELIAMKWKYHKMVELQSGF